MTDVWLVKNGDGLVVAMSEPTPDGIHYVPAQRVQRLRETLRKIAEIVRDRDLPHGRALTRIDCIVDDALTTVGHGAATKEQEQYYSHHDERSANPYK